MASQTNTQFSTEQFFSPKEDLPTIIENKDLVVESYVDGNFYALKAEDGNDNEEELDDGANDVGSNETRKSEVKVFNGQGEEEEEEERMIKCQNDKEHHELTLKETDILENSVPKTIQSLTQSTLQSNHTPGNPLINTTKGEIAPINPLPNQSKRKSTARKIAKPKPIDRDRQEEIEILSETMTKKGSLKRIRKESISDQARSVLRFNTLTDEVKQKTTDIVNELINIHQLPREVVLFALISHSGNIELAHSYLLEETDVPDWDFEDDLAILSRDSERMVNLLKLKSIEEITDRFEFLNRLCDAPA